MTLFPFMTKMKVRIVTYHFFYDNSSFNRDDNTEEDDDEEGLGSVAGDIDSKDDASAKKKGKGESQDKSLSTLCDINTSKRKGQKYAVARVVAT